VKDVNGGSKTNPSGTVDLSAPDGRGSFGSASCALHPVTGSSDTSRCDPDPGYAASSAGTNAVQAGYRGDATHAAGGSGPQEVTAAKHSSTTSVACAPAAVVAGAATTCTATVSDGRSGNPPRPGGTVAFTTDGSGSFGSSGSCTLPASGDNSCQVTYTAASAGSGTHAIGAGYPGDGNHTASSAQTNVNVSAPPALGGGGSTPAGEAPASTPDGFAISHRITRVRNGRALITLRCRGPRRSSCQGVVVLVGTNLTSRLRAAGNAATAARFTVAAGRTKVVRALVPKTSMTRLRHRRTAIAFATVTLTMPDGTKKTVKRAITLVRG
jgi:hypothetical protein